MKVGDGLLIKVNILISMSRDPSELRLANTIMHGRAPGNRGRDRPRTDQRCRIRDICEWTRSTPSKVISLAKKRDLRIMQH